MQLALCKKSTFIVWLPGIWSSQHKHDNFCIFSCPQKRPWTWYERSSLAAGTHVKVPFLLSYLQALHSALLRRCGRQIGGDSPAQEERLDSKMLCTTVRHIHIAQSDLLPRVRVCKTLNFTNRKWFSNFLTRGWLDSKTWLTEVRKSPTIIRMCQWLLR